MTTWHRPSACASNECAEVAATASGTHVMIRNTRSGIWVAFTRAEWETFIAGAKNGEFDLDVLEAGGE